MLCVGGTKEVRIFLTSLGGTVKHYSTFNRGGCANLCRRGKDRRKRNGALSIAEYCNRSYSSASTSNIDDMIFSVHFTSATDQVRLPTPPTADDRQRLDADFNAAAPADDDDICPYATFTEMERMQAARVGKTRPTDAGDSRETPAADNAVSAPAERRRTRPRKAGPATSDNQDSQHQRREPQHIAANNDLNALYAQPHKFINLTGDNQHAQSQTLFSDA